VIPQQASALAVVSKVPPEGDPCGIYTLVDAKNRNVGFCNACRTGKAWFLHVFFATPALTGIVIASMRGRVWRLPPLHWVRKPTLLVFVWSLLFHLKTRMLDLVYN
jgi:hypothetical protein